jgi:hypothetical protein
LTSSGPGTNGLVPTLRVEPRDTPAERADEPVEIEISDDLAVLSDQLEEWVAPMAHWELSFRQGHDFDRPDNVEARLLFVAGEQTSSLVFRLEQLDSIQEFERELWLTFEEDEGIAKAVHLTPFGLDVELHHIVGPPLGGTPA